MLAQCCFSINVHILLILYIHKTEKNVFLCLLNYQEDVSSTSLVTLNSKKHPISTVLPNVLTVLLFPIKWFLFKNTKYSSINKSLDIGQYVSNISLMKAGSPLVNFQSLGNRYEYMFIDHNTCHTSSRAVYFSWNSSILHKRADLWKNFDFDSLWILMDFC